MTSPSTAIAAAPRHLVPRSGENTHQKSRALPNRMVPRRRHTLDSGALGGRLHVRPTIAVSLGRSWLAHVPVELHSRRIRCTPNLGCCHLKGCAWRLIFFWSRSSPSNLAAVLTGKHAGQKRHSHYFVSGRDTALQSASPVPKCGAVVNPGLCPNSLQFKCLLSAYSYPSTWPLLCSLLVIQENSTAND